eukprot:g3430.t1
MSEAVEVVASKAFTHKKSKARRGLAKNHPAATSGTKRRTESEGAEVGDCVGNNDVDINEYKDNKNENENDDDDDDNTITTTNHHHHHHHNYDHSNSHNHNNNNNNNNSNKQKTHSKKKRRVRPKKKHRQHSHQRYKEQRVAEQQQHQHQHQQSHTGWWQRASTDWWQRASNPHCMKYHIDDCRATVPFTRELQPVAEQQQHQHQHQQSHTGWWQRASTDWWQRASNPHCMKYHIDDCRATVPFTRELQPDALTAKWYARPDHARSVLHWGQRKLLFSEIEFLLEYGYDNCKIVYAGAAPGNHIPFLSSLFPAYKFVLVDPNKFGIEESETIEIRNELFTDEMAKEFQGQGVLFISDIRTANHNTMKNKEAEQRLRLDNGMQRRWHLLMQPHKSMLKLRLSYTAGNTRYLSGRIYLPIWGPQSTTETRLVPDGDNEIVYDNIIYQDQMFFFNTHTRMMAYAHEVEAPGIDHCYDCMSEIFVLREWLVSNPERWLDAKDSQSLRLLLPQKPREGGRRIPLTAPIRHSALPTERDYCYQGQGEGDSTNEEKPSTPSSSSSSSSSSSTFSSSSSSSTSSSSSSSSSFSSSFSSSSPSPSPSSSSSSSSPSSPSSASSSSSSSSSSSTSSSSSLPSLPTSSSSSSLSSSSSSSVAAAEQSQSQSSHAVDTSSSSSSSSTSSSSAAAAAAATATANSLALLSLSSASSASSASEVPVASSASASNTATPASLAAPRHNDNNANINTNHNKKRRAKSARPTPVPPLALLSTDFAAYDAHSKCPTAILTPEATGWYRLSDERLNRLLNQEIARMSEAISSHIAKGRTLAQQIVHIRHGTGGWGFANQKIEQLENKVAVASIFSRKYQPDFEVFILSYGRPISRL